MAEENNNKDETAMDATRMSLGDHLEELRMRLIYAVAGLVVAMVLGLVLGQPLLQFLKHPYSVACQSLGVPDRLMITSAGAGLDAYLQLSFYFGLILAAPWILVQIWLFISAGLYPNERKYVSRTLPFSLSLFILGGLFFLWFVAVPALKFLIWFDIWMGLEPMVTLTSHMSFMTDMILTFGLAFQLPLAVLILAKVGIADMDTFNKFRKHVVVAIAAFSAIFAPGDPWSMILMAIPMWLLYELGVGLAYLSIRKQKQQEQADRLREEEEERKERERQALLPAEENSGQSSEDRPTDVDGVEYDPYQDGYDYQETTPLQEYQTEYTGDQTADYGTPEQTPNDYIADHTDEYTGDFTIQPISQASDGTASQTPNDPAATAPESVKPTAAESAPGAPESTLAAEQTPPKQATAGEQAAQTSESASSTTQDPTKTAQDSPPDAPVA